ncbi:MAG: VCBS repeat-containing protein [Paracoccaceae bacterium]|nr:VCBS repeat-containing protein [Paracoccaceae bacterium]
MILRTLMALHVVALGAAAHADEVRILHAEYGAATGRYDHGVLGDAEEWGSLTLKFADCPECTDADAQVVTFTLPESQVFEDTAPRIISRSNDGSDIVLVVEAHVDQGARMALYTHQGRLAATPYIGQPYRWLAPIGAADLDGDGTLEFAFVDRPHLARTIRIWQLGADGNMTEVASLPGFTNHRIGEDNIAGGIRDCGSGSEMIVADATWSKVHAVRFDGKEFSTRALMPHENRDSFARVMACQN